MGRDWSWVGGGGGAGGGSGNSCSSSSSSSSSAQYCSSNPRRKARSGERKSTDGSCRNSGKSKRSSHDGVTNSALPGCMSAVFSFFDFHHFHFHSSAASFKPHSSDCLPHAPSALRGVEAPRNSLESSEDPSLSPATKEENSDIRKFQMGMQIRTRPSSKAGALANNNDSCSDVGNSPSARTPNLVARLMGLELLPDGQSPSPSSSSSNFATPKLHTTTSHNNTPRPSLHTPTSTIIGHRFSVDCGAITAARSLPETPRLSLARRSDADVHHHHRLSLQLNKENMSSSEDIELSRLSFLKRRDIKLIDEIKSPGDYAKQIVKQVKESVSRRVGMMDITNTVRKNHDQDREVKHSKTKGSSKISAKLSASDSESPGKHPSFSQRLGFLENTRTKTISSASVSKEEQVSVPPKPPRQADNSHVQPTTNPRLNPLIEEPRQEQEQEHAHEPRSFKKCKKAEPETRFSPKIRKPPPLVDVLRNKQEEPFVRPSTARKTSNSNQADKKMFKITSPQPNDLFSITTVPSLLPVKKDTSPSATKLPQKQVTETQVPKGTSQPPNYLNQTHTVRNNPRGNHCSATASTARVSRSELEYITRILRRTGLDPETPILLAKWFSPSHPLDPSIFYFLEHFTVNTSTKRWSFRHGLELRCNRKLLFHLIDEVLVQLLKPHVNVRPWVRYSAKRRRHSRGAELTHELCAKIARYPRSDCRVLEDIDALVGGDFPGVEAEREMMMEEGGEGIATEIEKGILDELLAEAASDLRRSPRGHNGVVCLVA